MNGDDAGKFPGEDATILRFLTGCRLGEAVQRPELLSSAAPPT